MADVLGIALTEYLKGERKEKLWVHNNISEPEAYPIDYFFRDLAQLPELEAFALTQCDGLTLDVGAGSGCHSLILQENGAKVHANEISKACCKIMRSRGLKKVIEGDFYQIPSNHQYDTLLFLMNGIGLSKTLAGFEDFLVQCDALLKPGGQIICDTSDLVYMFPDKISNHDQYYGEVKFKWNYKQHESEWFEWLYLDPSTLILEAHALGWEAEVIFETDEEHYLVRIVK